MRSSWELKWGHKKRKKQKIYKSKNLQGAAKGKDPYDTMMFAINDDIDIE